jgi:hypothetical protein
VYAQRGRRKRRASKQVINFLKTIYIPTIQQLHTTASTQKTYIQVKSMVSYGFMVILNLSYFFMDHSLNGQQD